MSDPHAAVVKALAAAPSDFLVNTGDLVEDGGRAFDWQTFFDIEAPLLRDRALFVSIGNHELHDDRAGANFAKYFGFAAAGEAPRPYGTARVGSTRLFFLNAMHDWSAGEEREWLEQELTRADAEAALASFGASPSPTTVPGRRGPTGRTPRSSRPTCPSSSRPTTSISSFRGTITSTSAASATA